MPWDQILTGAIAEVLTEGAIKKGWRLFRESVPSYLSRLLGRTTHADMYLRMTSDQLRLFYRNEQPICFSLDNKQGYVVPATLVLQGIPITQQLEEDPVRFMCNSQEFEPPAEIRDAYVGPIRDELSRNLNGKLWNGSVLRLKDIQLESRGRWLATVQKAKYFDSLATNFAMDNKPVGRRQTLREMISNDTGMLGPYATSPLANHIGVVCLVESADGFLVVQHRSSNVANRGETLSASVSGAVDYVVDDLNKTNLSLKDIARATFRESYEELGIEDQNVRFLGMIREYLRGGKPEFYYYCRSLHTFREIEKAYQSASGRNESRRILKYEFSTAGIIQDSMNEKNRYGFGRQVEELLDLLGEKSNLTLVASIILTALSLMGTNAEKASS